MSAQWDAIDWDNPPTWALRYIAEQRAALGINRYVYD